MSSFNFSPKNLAEILYSELKDRSSPSPNLEILIDLFESMYFASLKTEESQPITFHIVYLDPDNADPNPPHRIVRDRWSYVRLAESIPITIPNLVKIAKASDPRTSSFAVYHDASERLSIWGLIDQGNRYHDFVSYNAESGAERPGVFQVSLVGIGHLVVYIGYEKIAELKINALLGKALDVLWSGPIHNALMPGIQIYIEAVRRALPAHVYNDRSHWHTSLTSYWVSSLCRLLLRMQNYRHGGAVLITPDTSSHGLNVKHRLQYSRLRSALETRALLGIQHTYASDQIFENCLEPSTDAVPTDLYLDETVLGQELSESHSELDGTLWFIALLTRVDGLLLMSPTLEVQGFGVEITCAEEPSAVFMAEESRATKKRLRKVDYNYYGTRHRSMMRYCAQLPGSVGFVISQDGDVRVMTQVRSQLVMWENIKLRLDDFKRRPRRRNKLRST
jgi:hypothetical protein